MLPTDTTSLEYIAARNAAMSRHDLRGLDAEDPVSPCGQEYGLRVSTRLTTDYRAKGRNQSMDIKPFGSDELSPRGRCAELVPYGPARLRRLFANATSDAGRRYHGTSQSKTKSRHSAGLNL